MDRLGVATASTSSATSSGAHYFVAGNAGAYFYGCMLTRYFSFFGALWLSFASACLLAADPPPNQVSEYEKASGWKLLFDGQTTKGWRSFKGTSFPEKGWVVENGWLHCLGKDSESIITEKQYTDYELQWEWKLAPKGNSGVKYFISEKRDKAVGHEYQLIDEEGEPDAKQGDGKRVTASFYDVLKPAVQTSKLEPGMVNTGRIIVRGNRVEHWLNSWKVLEYECGSEQLKQALAQSKFKDMTEFGNKITGHILLQNHHTEVWFRNIKIREL